MTDDHESKGPLEQAVELFVRKPAGFVLHLPRSVPRYLARGRDALTHPGETIDHLQAHAHRTLRALGIGTTSDEARGPLPEDADAQDEAIEADAGHGLTPAPPSGAKPTATAAPASSPVVAGATVVAGVARRADAPTLHAPRVVSTAEPAAPAGAPGAGVDPDRLAIPGYDSLSASQVVPRLESLAADELDLVRQYELANRGRKTILSKIAQLQA